MAKARKLASAGADDIPLLMSPLMYRIGEAATILDCSQSTVWDRIYRGRLIARKIRNCTRISCEDLVAHIQAEGSQVEPAPQPGPEFKRRRHRVSVAEYARGTVYILRAGDFVKIGFTRGCVRERIKYLQTGSPLPIKEVAALKGTQGLEYQLHRRFDAHRSSGEWFRREGALAEWIKGGCKP